jgi:hypothetical protein
MSQFTTELVVEQIGDSKYYRLLEGFDYHVGDYPSDEIISVPKGFITDFASSPKILWPILPPRGEYGKAAVIHDYCYFIGYKSKFRSDKIFLEGMEILGVPKFKREIMFHGVVILGWPAWINHRLGWGFKQSI